MGSEKRQLTVVLSVRLTPDERQRLDENSQACSMRTASFLRSVGLGYQPKSTIDQAAIAHLARLNVDLNRLGSLLRLWLKDCPRGEMAKNLLIEKWVDALAATHKDIEAAIALQINQDTTQ